MASTDTAASAGALRVVNYLVGRGGEERVSTRAIAQELDLKYPFLAKNMRELHNRGLLQTSRGMSGGVELGREPSEINLLEVLEAIDGPLTSVLGALASEDMERMDDVSLVYLAAVEAFRVQLAGINFEDLHDRAEELRQAYLG